MERVTGVPLTDQLLFSDELLADGGIVTAGEVQVCTKHYQSTFVSLSQGNRVYFLDSKRKIIFTCPAKLRA